MKTAALLLSMVMLANASALAQTFSVENIGNVGVGDVLTIQKRVCHFISDNEDRGATATESVPSGFEILSAEPIVIHRKHDAFIVVRNIRQPGQITIKQALGGDAAVQRIMTDARTTGGDDYGSSLALLVGTLSVGSVIDATTHASFTWQCHAEGHRYSSEDGEIVGDVKLSLIKAPTISNVQEIMLELATITQPVTEEVFRELVEAVRRITNYSRSVDNAE